MPNDCLNDSSSGKCRIVILVPNECLNDSSSGKCRIVILVPNVCLNDSSSGKCRIVMPQSGVGATPHKGLIRENNHSEYPGGRTIPGILKKYIM